MVLRSLKAARYQPRNIGHFGLGLAMVEGVVAHHGGAVTLEPSSGGLATGLRDVHEWTGGFERFWSESFDRLEEYVRELQRTEDGDGDG